MLFGDAVPWFLPGAAISVGISLAASGPAGRALGVRRPVAWVMILSLGLIASATLTPHRDALAYGATGPRFCDLSRVWLAPLREYLGEGDAGGNVLMFVPLGATVAMMPPSRRRTAVVLGAILLPFAIETSQLLIPALGRACESADVVDNLAGLALGLALGSGPAWWAGARR